MTEIIRISNIENYNLQFINGDLILKLKENYIEEEEYEREIEEEEEYEVEFEIEEEKKYTTIEEFNRLRLNNSKILYCIIKNGEEIISNKFKYRAILNDVWETMPIQKIIQNTTFNMKLTNENSIKGYIWSEKLKLSVQSKDSTYTMKEILNMIKINKYLLEISIKLSSGQIIHYKSNI
jgi:hypothetical protein